MVKTSRINFTVSEANIIKFKINCLKKKKTMTQVLNEFITKVTKEDK